MPLLDAHLSSLASYTASLPSTTNRHSRIGQFPPLTFASRAPQCTANLTLPDTVSRSLFLQPTRPWRSLRLFGFLGARSTRQPLPMTTTSKALRTAVLKRDATTTKRCPFPHSRSHLLGCYRPCAYNDSGNKLQTNSWPASRNI